MRRSWWGAACAAAVLCLPATSRAQEGGQGDGGQPPAGAEDEELDPLERLKKIAALMEKVEERLFEADTGAFTQDEQRRIVEAMRFEDKSADALEKLIRWLEEKQ